MTIPRWMRCGGSTRITAFLCVLTTISPFAHAQDAGTGPHPVTVTRGRVLELSLLPSLDTARVAGGDQVLFKLVNPLVADGETVLPPESMIHGYIFGFSHVGKDCIPRQLEFKIDSITTPNGESIPVVFIDKNQATADGKLLEEVPPEKMPGARRPSRSGKVLGAVTAPLAIASAPVWIPAYLYLSAKAECHATGGSGEIIPSGTRLYLAVERDTRLLTPAPTSAANHEP